MSLPRRSIQKLLRESFSGKHPLVLGPTERKTVGADLLQRIGRIEGVAIKDKGDDREDEKSRFVCAINITDPNSYYYYGMRDDFRLLLDDANRLTIHHYHYRDSNTAIVSDLDEVVGFVRRYRQRLDRLKALKAKRGKVRDLLSQAIVAHVRKLAKEDRFDFAFEPDIQKLNLYVKLSDQKALLLHIPFKNFKEFLPRLGPAIKNLRELHQSGVRFQIGGRRALPRRQTWVTHDSL